MSNPRKFSEKIALITQKEAEQTAAFEQIMKEVMDATASKPAQPQDIINKQSGQLLHPMNLGVYRGGSLPNVNSMSQHPDKVSQQNKMMFNPSSVSPRSSRNSIGPGPVRVKPHRTDHSPYASPPQYGGHSMSPNASNLGSPGLNFGTYLSPPSEPNWRRANSDSALNSINSSQLLIPSVVPDSSEESSNNSNDPRDTYGLTMVKPHDSPKAGDMHSLLEIPQSVSTGSLPDLTTFQFQTPLQQPLDPLDENQLNHSPYSTVNNSPLTGSSLAYSPTSLSPHPPPGMANHITSQPVNQSSAQQSQVQRPQQQSQQQQQQQLNRSPHSPQSILENHAVNASFQNFTPNDNILNAYRSPQRPSPQNSPQPFRSPSPLESQLSAPGSPVNQPTQQTADSYYLSQQANALQHHFEQISMGDHSPQRNNGHCNWQGGGMANSLLNFYNPPTTGATAVVTSQQSPQHQQPQTPQTPSSIPDIIFTEFLGTDFERSTADSVAEFLESEAAAVALREGLGPLDLDGPMLEMLRDPSLVQLDSNAEDSFRLDRL